MKNAEIIASLESIIDAAEYMKNAYFFTPPTNASGRRAYEKRWTRPEIEWTEGGHTYTAAYTVSCSCRNVYAVGTYTRDGKKTTLTAIRNSLHRLQAAAQ